MTKDCPTGMRAVRIRAARMIGVAFASLLVWTGFSLSSRPRSEYPYLLRLLLDRVEPTNVAVQEPTMGDMNPAMPMAAPMPTVGSSPHIEILTGETGSATPVHPVFVQGYVSIPHARLGSSMPLPMVQPTAAPTIVMGAPSSVAATDKSFLKGLPVDNAPREDPFAPEAKSKKRAAR